MTLNVGVVLLLYRLIFKELIVGAILMAGEFRVMRGQLAVINALHITKHTYPQYLIITIIP